MGKQLRRHDMRACRSFGSRDDDRSPRATGAFHTRDATHPQTDGQFLPVNRNQRQIHSLEIAFPDVSRRQVHASDAHARLGASGRTDKMGGGGN
jgi:hypothetical protein